MKHLKDIKHWEELKNQVVCCNCLEGLKLIPDNSLDSIVTDPPYGLSFMGKKWDYDVPSVKIWKECLRVLKPGGFLLAFAGARTQHRMACNIEDGGFEIRDMIAWVYGSGFPKSHNIGKAVDKLQGNEREEIGENPNKRPNSQENYSLDGKAKNFQINVQPLSKGTSPYEGWGTALKPALEPITVARKPFKGTVADNVLKYGTGGINIDGCRVGTETMPSVKIKQSYGNGSDNHFGGGKPRGKEVETKEQQGRFPANFIHDGSDEVVELFPETKSGAKKANQKDYNNNGDEFITNLGASVNEYKASSGSASRFFYCAKASKKDRNEGLEGFEEKNKKTDYGTFDKRSGAREESTPLPTKNNHPTVKPTKLMQYLVRLVTPKGGTCLDPFMGSGSTGKACKLEGFDFIGIDLDEDYCKIAEARINNLPKTLF